MLQAETTETLNLEDPVSNAKYGLELSVLKATKNPQTAVYLAMHQCYSCKPVSSPKKLNEKECGDIVVKRLLDGNRGHFSPLETATITFGLGYIPHSVLQQLLRSRIGISPSVQSFRYTCQHILDAADGKLDIEKVLYLRPVDNYHDRDSGIYRYDEKQRNEDISVAKFIIAHVARRLREGMPPEQARGQLSFDYRQHAVITMNARSLMSVLDRRGKKDAQKEIQMLAHLMLAKFTEWMPEIANWYEQHRWMKAMLSP